jgi:hypothetical protein
MSGERKVTLAAERWEHIIAAHPELEPHEAEILRAVQKPSERMAGREPNEEWFYLRGAGPSRWLKVVVVFDSPDTGRIITAFPRRRKP